jgi:hypothetical protein
MSYTVFMDTTLTIRADERLRAALEQRARTQGKTLSSVAREILEAAVPGGLRYAFDAQDQGVAYLPAHKESQSGSAPPGPHQT